MTLSVRRAQAGDLDAIMELETALFPGDAWSRGQMAEELASPHGYYVVAETDTSVDGYAGLRAPRGTEQGDIQTIGVAPAARRRGLGRRLLGVLLAEARDRGMREVFLEVRADNPAAQALYRAHGFDAIAVRPRYYQPDDIDAIVMRLVFPDPEVVPA